MATSVPVTGHVVLAGAEVSRRPPPSTAAQKVVVGHEMSVIAPSVCTRTGADHSSGAADAADAPPRAAMTAIVAAATVAQDLLERGPAPRSTGEVGDALLARLG